MTTILTKIARRLNSDGLAFKTLVMLTASGIAVAMAAGVLWPTLGERAFIGDRK